jgi:SMI1 / KNR4 family (SUKH-1)
LINGRLEKEYFFLEGSATDAEVEKTEQLLNLPLPNDYIDFLKFSNGCTLYKLEDIGGYDFLGTKDIFKETESNKEIYEEEWDDRIIIFCEIIGEGNYLGFRILENGQYEILDCFHELLPSEWSVTPYLLDEFMEKLIDNDGDKFWL